MYIGLCGFANSGKDEVGKILCDHFGYERRGVGDVLASILVSVNPLVESRSMSRPRRASVLLTGIGYEEAKENSEFRDLQIKLGDALRHELYEDCLIDALVANSPVRSVFTSTRYPNEASKVRDAGGVIWRVTRPGIGPASDHPTETAMLDYDCDAVIHNDGSLDDLVSTVVAEMGRLGYVRLVDELDPGVVLGSDHGDGDLLDVVSDAPTSSAVGDAPNGI